MTSDVFVRGWTGTIGSAVCDELRKQKANVLTCARGESAMDTPNLMGLVCCHGDYGPMGKFEKLAFPDWANGFQLNFIEQAKEVHRFVRILNGRRGRVVLMGGAGIGSGAIVEQRSSYASAKGALVHFVETVSHELPNVAINVIAPGPVFSHMTSSSKNKADCVSPDLAAKLAAWLILGESEHVTGRLLSARWDTWPIDTLSPDTYRLRRVRQEV